MEHMPYFDAHCDTLSRCAAKGWSLWENPGHLDLCRLGKYAPAGQVFALFLNSAKVPPEERLDALRAQTDIFHRARREYPERMERCCLSLEGAELVNCDEGMLEQVKAWGVRWVNLTWNHANALSGSCLTGEGLTERGKSFARRCWDLGMGIDVSHLSDRGFWDLMDIQAGPILASHSNSRTLCAHPRNLTDEMFRALVAGNGYIGLNFSTGFLGENPDCGTVIRHLEHFLSLGGGGNVGLGTDFDGTDVPQDLSGVEDMPNLWAAMERMGYPEETIRAVAWGNLCSFMERLRAAALC